MSDSTRCYPPLPAPEITIAMFEAYDAFSAAQMLEFADATFDLRLARGAAGLRPMPQVVGLARWRHDVVLKADADARHAFLLREIERLAAIVDERAAS